MWMLACMLVANAGPKARERKQERADPFSALNLERTLDVVVPLVERAAGRKFLTPPIVELATVEGMRAMVLEEDALISASVLRDTPEARRKELTEERARMTGTAGLLGKYGLFADKLVLCSHEIEAAVKGSGLPSSAIPQVLTLVLAHELTHTLHDQHVDLAQQIRELPDQDALWAASGTWEGLATWVSERVADDLDLRDTWVWMASLQGWRPSRSSAEVHPSGRAPSASEWASAGVHPEGLAHEKASTEGLAHEKVSIEGLDREKASTETASNLDETMAYPVWAMYGRGRDAIERHYQMGGFDRVWTVAAQPPKTSAGLFRPETWPAARVTPDIDYPAVLRTTDQALTKTDWVVGISVLGEFELRGEAVIGGNEAALDEILAHLRQSWALQADRPDRNAEVRILEFDDPSWPAKYLDLLKAQQTADAAQLAVATDREVEVTYTPFTQVEADVATLRTSRIQGAGGVSTERHSAWVVRKDTLVVVTAESFRPGLRLGYAVQEVFSRLDAAHAGTPLSEPTPEPSPSDTTDAPNP